MPKPLSDFFVAEAPKVEPLEPEVTINYWPGLLRIALFVAGALFALGSLGLVGHMDFLDACDSGRYTGPDCPGGTK